MDRRPMYPGWKTDLTSGNNGIVSGHTEIVHSIAAPKEIRSAITAAAFAVHPQSTAIDSLSANGY